MSTKQQTGSNAVRKDIGAIQSRRDELKNQLADLRDQIAEFEANRRDGLRAETLDGVAYKTRDKDRAELDRMSEQVVVIEDELRNLDRMESELGSSLNEARQTEAVDALRAQRRKIAKATKAFAEAYRKAIEAEDEVRAALNEHGRIYNDQFTGPTRAMLAHELENMPSDRHAPFVRKQLPADARLPFKVDQLNYAVGDLRRGPEAAHGKNRLQQIDTLLQAAEGGKS